MSESTQGSAASAPGRHPAWLLLLAGLLGWHVWMTLGLFDAERPWLRLTDDDPIVSGHHPLHFYHGQLGARSLRQRGSLSSFDPAFHAGYPKTPVFDGGSRPAELSLLFDSTFSARAYKIGLAVQCLLAPLLLFLAARTAGLPRGISALAVALGLLVWWGQSGYQAIVAGEIDLLLAALFGLAQLGLMIRYHLHSQFLALLGIVACGLLGWFAQPLFMVLLLPLYLVYYLGTAHRHPLAWHLPLASALTLTVAANGFWLSDWVAYWWIRVPPSLEGQVSGLPLDSVWRSPLWGDGIDRASIAGLLVLALVGMIFLYRNGHRLTARLTGLGAIGLFALATAGLYLPLLARLGACQLLVPALLFASLPAAFAIAHALGLIRRMTRTIAGPILSSLALPVVVWFVSPQPAQTWAERLSRPVPLEIGLGPTQTALIDQVQQLTSDEGRILWEDRRGGRLLSRWTALLPLLTQRSFMGGLDDGAGIEHASCGLVDGTLAGRSLAQWSDAELEDYCRRYNVVWIVCSERSCERFSRWATVGKPTPLAEDRWLFRVNRKSTYALAGRTIWCEATPSGILLADVEPVRVPGEEEGQVLLSLHYQAGMSVSPSRVRIEKALDPRDNIPFVRLRMKEPAGRVFITWRGR